jgi:hypothetical protein
VAWPELVLRGPREDGLVESAGAALLLFAALFFWVAAAHSYRAKVGGLYTFWLALLGMVLFVGFGEEISWGQRLLGIQTPELLTNLNAQGEINIHNLWLFQAYNPDGTRKGFFELMLNMSRLFSIFCLGYCLLVPMFYRWMAWFRAIVARAAIPLVPIALGCVFAANFVMFRVAMVLRADQIGEYLNRLSEMKESMYALALFLVAVHFFTDARSGQWTSLPGRDLPGRMPVGGDGEGAA